jgi:hypothetical protein
LGSFCRIGFVLPIDFPGLPRAQLAQSVLLWQRGLAPARTRAAAPRILTISNSPVARATNLVSATPPRPDFATSFHLPPIEGAGEAPRVARVQRHPAACHVDERRA